MSDKVALYPDCFFVIDIEVLADAIRNKNTIKGIKVGRKTSKRLCIVFAGHETQ